jgi:GTPase SAR1 family protein
MKMKPTYLMGSSGYLLVADGTRSETIDVAIELQKMASTATNNAPFILIINKSDLTETWEITAETIQKIQQMGWNILITSAKENIMVEDAFRHLTQRMLL